MEIVRIGRSGRAAVVAAAHLFDHEPQPEWTDRFLTNGGHHLFIAYVDEVPAGFVTGVEVTHPDKGTEMMLYELSVDGTYQRRGIGTALAEALRDLAVERGCRGMWVPTAADDDPAVRTYQAAGAGPADEAAILSWEFPLRGGRPRPE